MDFTWKGIPFAELSHEALLEAAREMARDLTGRKAFVPPQGNGRAADPRAIARMRGYTGEPCPDCMNFTLVRSGTCLKCDTCGSTTGCS